jgi:hypothetical protein
MTQETSLYDRDLNAWARVQIELLRQGRHEEIDVVHLIAELEDMGKANVRALESRLIILIAHLLKWQFQLAQLSERWQEFDGRSWRSTIFEQRTQVLFLLRKVPSLEASLDEAIIETYPEARRLALKETGLPASALPPACPYSRDQLLDDAFFPSP